MAKLEEVVEKKIKPIVQGAMHKYLGVSIEELNKDITSKLKRPLIDFKVDTSISFKKAKREFKKRYLKRLLMLNYGNISEAAKKAGVDRRSIHRLVKEEKVNVNKLRKDMPKPSYVKEIKISSAIEGILDSYKKIIQPERLEKMYKNVSTLSRNIVKELPSPLTLKEAEKEFEKEFIKKALEGHNNNITRTAKKIGLRYETLHRKIKSLGISSP